jgi:hypothetical protein
MPFYQKGDVRIRYEETGSGFPLLVTPGRRIELSGEKLADRGVQRGRSVQVYILMPAPLGAGLQAYGNIFKGPSRAWLSPTLARHD